MSVIDFYHSTMDRYGEVIKFVIYGGIVTIISWLLYSVFVWIGIAPFYSNILSWFCAVMFHFVTNKWLIFNSKSADKKTIAYETGTFFIGRAITGLMVTILFPILYNAGLNQTFLGTDGLLAKIVTTVFEMGINFLLSKYLVFKSNK